MNNQCKSGFPKSFHSSGDFLSALLERNADIEYISLHTNSEKETGSLHNLMWDMEKQGYIQVRYKDIENNNTLFTAKLTISGVNLVNRNAEIKRNIRFNNITIKLSYVAIIMSALSLIVAIIALLV